MPTQPACLWRWTQREDATQASPPVGFWQVAHGFAERAEDQELLMEVLGTIEWIASGSAAIDCI
jgi:hypothetical protein